MTGISLSLQLLLTALLIVYAVYLFRSRLNPKVVRRAALIIFLAGTVLLTFGFGHESYVEGFLTRVFRSAYMTIKMFVYDGELIELEESQHSPYFLELYFFIFYAAMMTSISALILLFGKKAATAFLLFFRKRKFRHIFVGVNNRSKMTASGIEGEDIAFIEFPSDSEGHKVSMEQVISGMAEHKKDHLRYRKHTSLLSAKRNLEAGMPTDNIFATIGLEKLKKLISADTAFYIMSEDTARNLDDLMALLRDDSLKGNTIHVCLSREGVARYYKTIMKHTGVHIIYPSSLSVVELMTRADCHPAYVMQPVFEADGSPTGAVDGEFNALVVGFGETGQAVTKFLYEFSSAVYPDGTPLPAHITVCDNNINRLKGQFIFDNPEMGESGVLSFENEGTDSQAFWDRLMQRIDSLNYIAISLKDDAANQDLACTIFNYALKKRRGGLDGLRIAVRKRRTFQYDRKLIEGLNAKAGCEAIICYGEYEKIFTPEMIVSEKGSGINMSAITMAGEISNAYTAVSGEAVPTETGAKDAGQKSRAHMELHQLISRSNNLATLSILTGGRSEVSAKALENLSRREHLRYQRYLTAHSYSFAETDNDSLKTSHQICGWESLSGTDREYHRDMVLAQLSLLKKNDGRRD